MIDDHTKLKPVLKSKNHHLRMLYEIDTLSLDILHKILLVLENINLSSELHNRRNFLFYMPEGLVGVA